MRFYRIIITDPSSGNLITPPGFSAGLLGGATYASFANGRTIPSAWNVELDIPVIGQATPQGNGFVRVWGISRQEIGQANDLNGKNIQVFAGMQKGLPLANPSQAGLIAQGVIFQAFGNWIGTDQTLDMIIIPGSGSGSSPGGVGTLAKPANIVLDWKKGTPLAQALQTTLQTAFPNYKATINVNASLIRPNDEAGFFPTLEQLAQYVRAVSRDMVKTAGYPGVSIVLQPDNSIAVTDGASASGAAKAIAFNDLIGQPTWIESPNIQFHCVMRADLSVGQDITLPQTVVTNTQQASSSLLNQQTSFQGGFTILNARHVGNFRQPIADSWVTVYEAAPKQVSA